MSKKRTPSVNIHEAKSRLSEILRRVEERGERVLISRNGKVIAQLTPVTTAVDPLSPDPELRKIVFFEDPSRPATEADWPENAR